MRDSRKVVLTMKIFRNVTTVVLTAVMVQSLLATGLAVTTSAYETPKNESTAQTQVQESSAETMFYGGFEYFVSSDNQYIGITKYTGSDEEPTIEFKNRMFSWQGKSHNNQQFVSIFITNHNALTTAGDLQKNIVQNMCIRLSNYDINETIKNNLESNDVTQKIPQQKPINE